MIGKCTVCKKEFNQKTNERTCGNHYRQHYEFDKYVNYHKLFFEDPIYQWYREFISNEQIPPKMMNSPYIFKEWA